MSQSEGSSTSPPRGDAKQSHTQPEKSMDVPDSETDSQEVYSSCLSSSLALQSLEEVKTSLITAHTRALLWNVIMIVLASVRLLLDTGSPTDFCQLRFIINTLFIHTASPKVTPYTSSLLL